MDILLDAFLDSVKMLPFLLLAYAAIEYLEHKAGAKLQSRLENMGFWGPVGGSILGLVPQCGFAAAATNFYAGRILTVGTLLAVFLSTSDEAIPVLLSHPSRISYLLPMLAIKGISGLVFGLLIDGVYRLLPKRSEDVPFEELCSDCDCDHHGIWYSAWHHAFGVLVFVFIINVVLSFGLELIGAEKLGKALLGDSVFQPFLAALIGLIPNCGASVLITELFASGSLRFGSCIAGLCAGAGTGLLVLFRTNRRMKENVMIIGLLYACAVITGLIVNLF